MFADQNQTNNPDHNLNPSEQPKGLSGGAFESAQTGGPENHVLSLVGELEDRLSKIKNLQQQSAERDQQLLAREQQLQSQTQELAELNQALSEREQQLTQQRQELESQAQTLENQQQTLNEQNQATEQGRQALEHDRHQLEQDLQALQSESDGLNHQRQELEQREQTLAQRQDELTHAQTELEQAKQACEQAQQTCAEEKQACEQTRQTLDSEEQNLREQQAQFAEEKQQLESDQAELAQQQQQLQEQTQFLESQRQDLHDQQQQLEARTQELEQSWENFRQETDQLEAKLDSLREKQEHIDASRDEISQAQQALAEERESLKQLQHSLEQREQDFVSSQDEKIQALEQTLAEKRQQAEEHLEQTRTVVQQELDDKRQLLETDRMELTMREEALQAERQTIEQMRRRVAEQAAKAKTGSIEADELLNEQLQEVQSRQDAVQDQAQDLQNQRDALSQERAALVEEKAQIGLDTQTLHELKTKLTEQEEKLEQAQAKLQDTQEQLKQSRAQAAAALTDDAMRVGLHEVESLTRQLNAAKIQTQDQQDKLQALQAQLDNQQSLMVETEEEKIRLEQALRDAAAGQGLSPEVIEVSNPEDSQAYQALEEKLNEASQTYEAQIATLEQSLEETQLQLENAIANANADGSRIDQAEFVALKAKAEKYERRKKEIKTISDALNVRRIKLSRYKHILRERSKELKEQAKALETQQAEQTNNPSGYQASTGVTTGQESVVIAQKIQGLERERQMLVEVKKFLERSENDMVSRWATQKSGNLAVLLVFAVMAMGAFSYGVSLKFITPEHITTASIAIPAPEGQQPLSDKAFLETYRQQLFSDEVMKITSVELERSGHPEYKNPAQLRSHLRQKLTVSSEGQTLKMRYDSATSKEGEPLLTALNQGLFKHRVQKDREAGLMNTTATIQDGARTVATDVFQDRLKLSGMIFGGLAGLLGLLWLIARIPLSKSKRVFEEESSEKYLHALGEHAPSVHDTPDDQIQDETADQKAA